MHSPCGSRARISNTFPVDSMFRGLWASHRRQKLLTMIDQLDASLKELDQAVAKQAEQNPLATLLMTHPGVGPVTSMAFVLTLGPVERFERSKQVVSYLGLNPCEHSSAGRQRLFRSDLEAGQSERQRVWMQKLRQDYQRLKIRRGSWVAKVAIARKLAVRMYWMLRSPPVTRSWFACKAARGAPWWASKTSLD